MSIGLLLALLLSFNGTFAESDTLKPLTPFPNPDITYIWPTNASDYMSASFGETRSAHFHAAIDIGTWAREGYEVYAARDGKLFRAGVSPVGYGNVVYLQHDDDSFTVYAHLQDFAPEIRALVDSVRFTDYRMSFDQFLSDHNVHFKQGDVIGRTGSTGIGPPHLHFEVRSSSNNAVNPKLAGIHIPDSVPPVFSSLAVIPFDADSYVEGTKQTSILPARRSGNTFDFGEITTSGPIGLAVNVSDRSDHGRNVYAVYELEMELNGKTLFHARADSFPMADTRKMLLDRVYPLLLKRRGGFQRLHILPSNSLPFYDRNLGDGLLHAEAGTHEVIIRARDYYRNESVATLTLKVEEPSDTGYSRPVYRFKPASHSQPAPLTQNRANPERYFRWNSGWITPLENLSDVSIRFRSSGFQPGKFYDKLEAHRGIRLEGEQAEISTSETGAFTLNRVLPGRSTTLRYPAGRMELQFSEHTLFDTTYVHAERFSRGNRNFIRIGPDSEPLGRPVSLRVFLPDSLHNEKRTGLYFTDEQRDRSVYMTSEVQGDVLQAKVEGFGLYEIRVDTTKPELSRPRIWQRRNDGRWFVSVDASDEGSGIDHNKTVFIVNDRRGIGEHDPFGKVIHYHHPEFEPLNGANMIEITVYDHAGNRTSEKFELQR